nr:hypothetical protein [Tanacetum cinerariifolium]
MAQLSCSNCGGLFNGGNCPSYSIVVAENELVHDPNQFPYDNTPDFSYQPPQHHVETYSCELCGNDSQYGYDCPPQFLLVYEQEPSYNQNFGDNYYSQNSPSFPQQYLCCDNCGMKVFNYTINHQFIIQEDRQRLILVLILPSLHDFNSICYDDHNDDDEEKTIPLRDIIFQLLPSIVITTSPPVLPIQDPEDSLVMGNEELSTIPKKESDEVKKSSVEDFVPIPNESEDTSRSDSECNLHACDDFSPIDIPEGKSVNSECNLHACDDFSPIDIPEGKSVTFSNPLFDSNDDFTSSDDESLSDEDVSEDNFKTYSNPLFEFDDEYISSNVNPLFDEVLENIENKDSYVSNLDEPDLIVTPLSDANKDECFDPGDDVDGIELLLHRDPSTPEMSVASILKGFTNEPPLEKNDDLFDLESKENEWKKILYDAPIDDLMTEDKVFDPKIHEKNISPTYVRLPFENRHYIFLTYVIRIFLPYFTYPVDSHFLFSSQSKDTIFDPGISTFHF